jgi:hypothetical protein
MPGTVIGKQMNLGYAGSISRLADAIVDNRILQSILISNVESQPGVAFGEPVILNANNSYTRFGATGTMANLSGIAVREVKQSSDYFGGTGAYNPGDATDVLVRGSITVFCNNGTPTAGGAVYIRTAANVSFPLGVVGQFEAAADGTNTLLITNMRWTTGQLDANKIAEVTITSIVNP